MIVNSNLNSLSDCHRLHGTDNTFRKDNRMDILNIAEQRYATKAYDSTQRISEAQFKRLLSVLRLSPSSINIQPWHFFVADQAAAKNRIATSLIGKYAYNAPKVLDASHTIVLCTKHDISQQHLDDLLAQDERSGRFPTDAAKQSQQASREGYVEYYRSEKGDIARWAENQTFIALGQLLLAAASEGIDATPIGGFNEALLAEELQLAEQGLFPSVIVSLGYHHKTTDFNANLPKSRLPEAVTVSYL